MDIAQVVLPYMATYSLSSSLIVHEFFAASNQEFEFQDEHVQLHHPREWFIAPISIIERAIELTASNEAEKYTYNELPLAGSESSCQWLFRREVTPWSVRRISGIRILSFPKSPPDSSLLCA